MIEVQSLIDWEANVLMAVASVHYCIFHYCLVDNQCIKWRCICVFLYLHLMQSKVRFNVTAWWPSGAPQPLWPRKSSPLIYLQIQIKYIYTETIEDTNRIACSASHCLFLFLKVAKEHISRRACSKGMKLIFQSSSYLTSDHLSYLRTSIREHPNCDTGQHSQFLRCFLIILWIMIFSLWRQSR